MTTLKQRLMEVLEAYGEDFYTENQLIWRGEDERYAYYNIIDTSDKSLINELRIEKDFSRKTFKVYFLGMRDWIYTFDIRK